jgi:hypothetical protein
MKHQGGLRSKKIRAWNICHSHEENIKGDTVTMTQIDILKTKNIMAQEFTCHSDKKVTKKQY